MFLTKQFKLNRTQAGQGISVELPRTALRGALNVYMKTTTEGFGGYLIVY